jgi:hypothetical protein
MVKQIGGNAKGLLKLGYRMERKFWPNCTGMKPMEKVEKQSRLKNTWSKPVKHIFMLCVNNKSYEASLELRKLYEKIGDKEAERHGQIRIIDESGEDYVYPADYFAPVSLLEETKNKILEKV